MYENNILVAKDHDYATNKFQLDLGKINFHVRRVSIEGGGLIGEAALRRQVGHRQDGSILCDEKCVYFSYGTRQH